MAKEYEKEGVPLLRSLNIKPYVIDFNNIKYISKTFHERIVKSKIEEGDVLVVRTGVPGTSCVVPNGVKELNCSDLVIITTDRNKLNPYFLSFYFNSIAKNYVFSQKVGAIQQHFNIGSAKEMEIYLPPIGEQNKIADVINSLNEKIDINNRINQELEAMARLIYDYWFVQFDFPISKALAAQLGNPALEGKPYKTSGGPMTYNHTLKREIPEGWGVEKITNFAAIKAGGDKPKNISEIKTEEFSVPIFSNGISNEGLYGYTTKPVINRPSITITARGTIGYGFMRTIPFFPIIRLIVMTPNNSNLIEYLYEYCKRVEFDVSGSVQRQLTVPQVSNMKIMIPSEDISWHYSKLNSPITLKKQLIKEQNQKLTELRDWLLPMLMNGQVTVGGN